MTPSRPFLPAAFALTAFLSLGSLAQAQQTSILSVSSTGVQGNHASNRPDIAANGGAVCFESNSTTFITGDTNFVQDVFVRDLSTGVVERVSVGPLGVQGNGESKRSVISGDGRYVAFIALASNFGGLDFNGTYDIFVRDRTLGTTTLVSQGLTGMAGNGLSTRPAISDDGNSIAYRSLASDLVTGDTNFIDDIFVYDQTTGTTERVSVDSFGVQGNATSDRPTISADGSKVAFWSDATNLVPGDVNFQRDIFLRDRTLGTTSLVSISTAGVQGNGPSSRPSISADGRFVAFTSDASNLVAGDTNLVGDVFVRDLVNGTTELISKSTAGALGNGLSSVPSISADGRYVAYRSLASNLVPNDINNTRDVFLYDRLTGTTTILSVDSNAVLGNGASTRPSIQGDGSQTVFQSFASDLVAVDTNLSEDVFLQASHGVASPIAPSTNLISLAGPTSAQTGTSLSLSWSQAPPSSPYWLIYSFNLNGLLFSGHQFDVGNPATVLTSGLNTAAGTGSYLTPAVPASMLGRTVYLEIAARDALGALSDSNALGVTFF